MLPRIPHKQTKRTQEIVAFRGMNRTQNTQDGDILNAQNLSTAEYPTITQRGKRTVVQRVNLQDPTDTGEYSSPTDVYAWDGHLVVVDGGVLYYDGRAIDNVSEGKKQFAVVNTKLCIWPDKTFIDMTNGEYGHLNAQTNTSNTVTIATSADADTFTASLSDSAQLGVVTVANMIGSSDYTYAYGTDEAAVRACWVNGQWKMDDGLSQLESKVAAFAGELSIGKIFIPRKSGNAYFPVYGNNPDRSKYNTEGYYAVVTNVVTESYPDPQYPITWSESTITYNVYSVTVTQPVLTDFFKAGDTVSLYSQGHLDVKHATIRSITSNAMTFDKGTFSETGTKQWTVTITREVPDLTYICEKDNRLWGVSNSQRNQIWNPDTQSYDTYTSRVIYASALGDPTNWWTFDGLDSDSYQVAVGSEGDFTGICSFANAVCCWKEDALHKILGSYPSEYYMHTSHIEGVANGSYRSLTVVNEVLYYNGATGVYAYTGSTPSLIGYPLGTLYKDVSAGSNGLRWYFSGTKPDGTKELVVYDLTHRIWTREDDSDAVGFAMIGSDLYMLVNSDNIAVPSKIYLVEQGVDDSVQWSAEFVAFDETALIRKYYLRILLRVEFISMGTTYAGSSINVYVKYDNDQTWRLLYGEGFSTRPNPATYRKPLSIELPVKRCDKMQIKLSGTGNVRIREFTREFIQGSERV